jgi:hypothetical protein
MRNLLICAVTAASLGYVANDAVRELGFVGTGAAHAEVAGMSYYELRRDRDFRRAVEEIAEEAARDLIAGCAVDGYVDDDYFYGGTLNC